MRLHRQERFSLGSAAIEIVLIFVGITTALWFDNWNTERQDRKKEIEILKSLGNDLEMMIARTRQAYVNDSLLHASGLIILKDLNDPSTLNFSDSLARHYAIFYLYDFPEAKHSTLLNLRAEGIDLIENDSLKRFIVDFFDMHEDINNYMTKLYLDQYNYEIQPFLNQHVVIERFSEQARPLNYQMLKKDKLAINRLNNFLQHRYSLMLNFKVLVPPMQELRERILKEVAHLE